MPPRDQVHGSNPQHGKAARVARPPHPSKQARFIAEYLIDLNATQAAIRAGYSLKTAKQQGARPVEKC